VFTDSAPCCGGNECLPQADVVTKVTEVEQELRRDSYALNQFFVDLGKPWSGGVVADVPNKEQPKIPSNI